MKKVRKVTITIQTENAAFETPELEVARILKDLGQWFETHGLEDRNLRDFNGNKVGEVKVR